MLSRFPAVIPEFDTVRLFFPCQRGKRVFIDYGTFFALEFKAEIASFQKVHNDDGSVKLDKYGYPEITTVWEKRRLDHKCSWWCKMQIFEDYLCFGKMGKSAQIPCICCEFSVSKWYNFTNGINRGVILDKYELLAPCCQALKRLNLLNYTAFENWGELVSYLFDNVILRRLDISYNFRVDDVGQCMRLLSLLRLNNKESGKHSNDDQWDKKDEDLVSSHIEGDYSTVSWGGKRGSHYKAMFYDKYLEQKRLFSMSDIDNTTDEKKAKKAFWNRNKNLYLNVVRFEVQYNSKYFLSRSKNYKYSRGLKMLDNLINLCATNWVRILQNFDKQLNSLNTHDEKEYIIADKALNKLDSLRSKEGISRTKCANLQLFICDCHKRGWKKVHEELGKTNFGYKYREVKTLTNFDVKLECLAEVPIMRIMESNGYSYTFEHNFAFKSGFVRQFDLAV